MPLSLHANVSRTPGCVSANLGDSVAILQPDSGVYFGLNEVGASVWHALDTPRKLQEILDGLLAEFEVDEETCRADLLELVGQLEAQKLVSVQG